MAFRLALTILAGIALMSAAPTASAQQVEGIAAVVNDQPITTLDVRDRMRLIISSAGVQPTEEMLARIQDQAMRGLVETARRVNARQDVLAIVRLRDLRVTHVHLWHASRSADHLLVSGCWASGCWLSGMAG